MRLSDRVIQNAWGNHIPLLDALDPWDNPKRLKESYEAYILNAATMELKACPRSTSKQLMMMRQDALPQHPADPIGPPTQTCPVAGVSK